jgi:hypothetical protein
VESLRERLHHKEETIKRFEHLLMQANQEHEAIARAQQEEIGRLEAALRSQQAAYNSLRSSQMPGIENLLTSGATIQQYVTHIQELEEEVRELQESLSQMTGQLAASQLEAEKVGRQLAFRTEEVIQLKTELQNQAEGQFQNLQQQGHYQQEETNQLLAELRTCQQENYLLKEDVAQLKLAAAKSPSAVLKSLVDRLRIELAEKEKKQKAMSRVIAELRNDMLMSASVLDDGTISRAGSKLQQDQSMPTGIVARDNSALQNKLDEQLALVSRLKRQLRATKEQEAKALADAAKFREIADKKSSLILKLREEKLTGARNSPSTRRRADGMLAGEEDDEEEKAELRSRIQALEEKLQQVNRAEKPYEDHSIHQQETDQEASRRLVKNAEEVARWDEKKKWQKRVEEYKQRLKEADEEVAKLTKSNLNLRETVTRLDREKAQLDHKWKAHLKIGAAKSSMADGRLEALEAENSKLRAQIGSLEQQGAVSHEPGVETLKLRVRFLQERIEQQEKKISLLELGKKSGHDGLLKEIDRLRKSETEASQLKTRLEEENVELKVKVEAGQHSSLILKETLAEMIPLVQAHRYDGGDNNSITIMDQLLCLCQRLEKIVQDSSMLDNNSGKRPPRGSPSKHVTIAAASPGSSPTKTVGGRLGRRLSAEIETMAVELNALKEANVKLKEAAEVKERKIAELGMLLREATSAGDGTGNIHNRCKFEVNDFYYSFFAPFRPHTDTCGSPDTGKKPCYFCLLP